MPIQTLT